MRLALEPVIEALDHLQNGFIGALCLISLSACAPGQDVDDLTAAGNDASWRHWQPALGQPALEPLDAAVARDPHPVILALHGFNDYSNAFQDFASFAASKGIAVHAYDQRGFGANPDRGLWPGIERLTADLRNALARLRKIYGEAPIYVLGESMGGAVAIVAAADEEPLDAAGLILVAPAVWGGSHLNPFYRATLWLASTFAPGWSLGSGGLKISPSDNIEMLRAFSADPMVIKVTRTDAIAGLVQLMDKALASAPRLDQHVLLLFGEKDEVVPVDALWDFRNRLEQANLAVVDYTDGYHMLLRDLQRQAVFEDILNWIGDVSPEDPGSAVRD